MFGPLQVQLPGVTLSSRDFRGVKPKALFELSLLARGRIVPKERLADQLWGEELPQRVAPTIESYVSVLRHRLDAVPGLGRRVIRTEHRGYRLCAELVDVDVDRFQDLLRRAAACDGLERRAALEEATMAAGELLADEAPRRACGPLRCAGRHRLGDRRRFFEGRRAILEGPTSVEEES